MDNFTPFSALAGGSLIGLGAALLLLLNGRIAGVSGILGGIVGAIVPEATWRVAFIAGWFCRRFFSGHRNGGVISLFAVLARSLRSKSM